MKTEKIGRFLMRRKCKTFSSGKKRLDLKAVIIILVILIIITSATYLLIYKKKCLNQSCFINSLWKCNKITFLNAQENSTWYYSINGVSSGNCLVTVKSINLKSDIETATALIGKSMECEIPRELSGSFMPESKIEYCHGLLKEALQDLIIKKMHLFIIQNIGQINQASVTPI